MAAEEAVKSMEVMLKSLYPTTQRMMEGAHHVALAEGVPANTEAVYFLDMAATLAAALGVTEEKFLATTRELLAARAARGIGLRAG